jgi:hypothetical protein
VNVDITIKAQIWFGTQRFGVYERDHQSYKILYTVTLLIYIEYNVHTGPGMATACTAPGHITVWQSNTENYHNNIIMCATTLDEPAQSLWLNHHTSNPNSYTASDMLPQRTRKQACGKPRAVAWTFLDRPYQPYWNISPCLGCLGIHGIVPRYASGSCSPEKRKIGSFKALVVC